MAKLKVISLKSEEWLSSNVLIAIWVAERLIKLNVNVYHVMVMMHLK